MRIVVPLLALVLLCCLIPGWADAPPDSATILFETDTGMWDSANQSQWEPVALPVLSQKSSLAFQPLNDVFGSRTVSSGDREVLLQFPEVLISSSRAGELLTPHYLLLARVKPGKKSRVRADLLDVQSNERYPLDWFEGNNPEQAATKLAEALHKKLDRIRERATLAVVGIPSEANLYHLKDADHINKDRAVPFASEREARRAGYRPCPVCFPEENPALRDDTDDADLGQNMAQVMKLEFAVSKNTRLDRMEDVARRLLTANHLPDGTLTFSVVNSDEIWSVAYSGGGTYLTTGLLDVFEGDDERAAVIAHELAHVQRDHFMKLYAKAYEEYGPAPIIRIERRNAYGDFLFRFHGKFLREGYPADMEQEADQYAILYLMRAGYKPASYTAALRKIQEAVSKNQGKKSAWTKIHPMSDDRTARLAKVPADITEMMAVASSVSATDPGASHAIDKRVVQLMPSIDAVRHFIKVLVAVDNGPLPSVPRGEPELRN